MNEVPSSRRRWLSFSLRELLLLMLALVGFIAWGGLLYESYQPFRASEFYLENMDWRDDIAAALTDIGEEPRSGGFAATQNWGRSANQSTVGYRIRLPSSKSGAFIQALKSRIRSRMTAAGCTLGGGAESNSGVSQMIAITYRAESSAGSVNACFFPSEGSHAELVVSVHEQRGGKGGLSAGASAGRAPADE